MDQVYLWLRQHKVRVLWALGLVVVALISTENSVSALRHFWSSHPLETNLVTGLVALFVTILLIDEVIERAHAARTAAIAWELEQPMRDHLGHTLTQAKELLDRYLVPIDPDDPGFRRRAAELSSEVTWKNEVAAFAEAALQGFVARESTYGFALQAPQLVPFASAYAETQQLVRHLHRRVSDGLVGERAARELTTICSKITAARRLPPTAPHRDMNDWTKSHNGKGLLILDPRGDRGFRLITWDADDGLPTHVDIIQRHTLDLSDVTAFQIKPNGEVDVEDVEKLPEILAQDPRLRSKTDWGLA